MVKLKFDRSGMLYNVGKPDKKVKSTFRPNDPKEYRSLKIMFHKTLPKYHMRAGEKKLFSYAYYGAGFLTANVEKITKLNKSYNVYDINSAYQSVLINKQYPLDAQRRYIEKPEDYKTFIKKHKNDKYMAYVKILAPKRKYHQFYYNIYTKQLGIAINFDMANGGLIHCGWLCDVDFKNFLKLYTFKKLVIAKALVFKKVGYLGEATESFIKEKFEKLNAMERGTEERQNYKISLHICTYGKNCQIKYENSRSKYILIGIYQSAYVRERMIDLMIKYKDKAIYIDTDSLFVYNTCRFREKIGDKLGQFKIEHKNVKINFLRFKGYVIYKNNKIYKQVISGCNKNFTREQIDRVLAGGTATITQQIKKEKVKYTLANRFKNGYNIEV